MNELVKITTNENGQSSVSGRELHAALEVQTPYRIWIDRMLEYGFDEGIDWGAYKFVHPQNKQQLENHTLSLDTAKEIAMLQRTEKGKQIRRYFIEVENRYRQVICGKTSDYLSRKLEATEDELLVVRKQLGFFLDGADGSFEFVYVSDVIAEYMKRPFRPKHFRMWLENHGIWTKANYRNGVPAQQYKTRGWFKPIDHKQWTKKGFVHETEYQFTVKGLKEVLRIAIEERYLRLPTPQQALLADIVVPQSMQDIAAVVQQQMAEEQNL